MDESNKDNCMTLLSGKIPISAPLQRFTMIFSGYWELELLRFDDDL